MAIAPALEDANAFAVGISSPWILLRYLVSLFVLRPETSSCTMRSLEALDTLTTSSAWWHTGCGSMKIHNSNPHRHFIFSVNQSAHHAVLHLQKRGFLPCSEAHRPLPRHTQMIEGSKLELLSNVRVTVSESGSTKSFSFSLECVAVLYCSRKHSRSFAQIETPQSPVI